MVSRAAHTRPVLRAGAVPGPGVPSHGHGWVPVLLQTSSRSSGLSFSLLESGKLNGARLVGTIEKDPMNRCEASAQSGGHSLRVTPLIGVCTPLPGPAPPPTLQMVTLGGPITQPRAPVHQPRQRAQTHTPSSWGGDWHQTPASGSQRCHFLLGDLGQGWEYTPGSARGHSRSSGSGRQSS